MIIQPEPGMRIKTTKLGSTRGMLIAKRHLDARASGVTGTIVSHVPDHEGDVWFVQHDDSDDIGAYCIDEIEEMSPLQATTTGLIDRIESTLATLDQMVAQARDNIDISTDQDVNTLARVLDGLQLVEDTWPSAQAQTNAAINQARPFAPFEAWDLIAHERVMVGGWYDLSHYRLTDDRVVHLSTITTNIPQWLKDAEQRLADAADERATRDDAFGPEVQ